MVNKFREDHLYIDAVILEGVGKYINAIADAVDLGSWMLKRLCRDCTRPGTGGKG